MVVCDGIRPSRVEESVFHLRGARCHVKVIDVQTDHAVFYGQIDPAPLFPDTGDLLPLDLPIYVHFPEVGRYTIQVWFFQESTADVLKMEQ